MIKTLDQLVTKFNKEAREGFLNLITAEESARGKIKLTHKGWVKADADLVSAHALLGVILEACIEARLEDFESVRSGLAKAFEAIVRPQGKSAVDAWRRMLSIQVDAENLPIPRAEKIITREVIKISRRKRLEDERSPLATIVVRHGDYVATCKGGHWVVEKKY